MQIENSLCFVAAARTTIKYCNFPLLLCDTCTTAPHVITDGLTKEQKLVFGFLKIIIRILFPFLLMPKGSLNLLS